MSRTRSKRSGFIASRNGSFRTKFLMILLTIIFLSCVYIWQRITVVTLSACTKGLRVEIKQKQKVRKYLQIEVTKLSSVQRIEKLGRALGFAYPRLGQIGLIRESPDSTYLETPGLAKSLWTRLKSLRNDFLFPGDEAFAKEIKPKP
ncbi:MAG: hypothetical protein GTO24_13860 [candidate division Zixibacteria bacterium]|nr:hypothetical protein [candidate division Zixibacteria bacterium]